MHDVRIRPATLADAAVLAELGRRTFLETFVEGFAIAYPAHDLDPFLERKFSQAAAAAEIADPALGVWLAEAAADETHGEALGYAVAGPAGLPHPDLRTQDGELYRLYLAKPAQGRGLAPRLMETALSWLDPDGGRRLWLGVWSANLRAQRFYARYGFQKAGEYDYRVGASIDHEFIFRRG